MSAPHRLDTFKHGHRVVCIGVLISSFLDILEVGAGFEGVQDWAAEQSSLLLTQGGLASSAWHIDQMVQPPRLGCLGMCTGQCAVVDVSSKCWRSMLVLDMRLYTRYR